MGAEVVIKSGRRRAQVMEDARLIGQRSYIFEMGCGLVIDGEGRFLTGGFSRATGLTIHDQIEQSGRRAAARALPGRLEPHAPWHTDRQFSHLFRGNDRPRARRTSCSPSTGHGDLRLVDNGEIERADA